MFKLAQANEEAQKRHHHNLRAWGTSFKMFQRLSTKQSTLQNVASCILLLSSCGSVSVSVCVCVRSLSRFNPRKKSDISTDMSYLLCVASTYMLHLIILCMSSWNAKWLQHGVVVTWWPRYWPVYRDAWQHCLDVLSCSQGFWSMSLELSSRDSEFHSTGVLSSKSACVHSNLCLDSEVNTKLSLKIFS